MTNSTLLNILRVMNNIKKQSLWDGSSAGLPTMNGVGESRTSASMSGQSGTYGHCQRNGNIIYSTEASTIQSTCCANPTVACTTTSTAQRHQSAERPILHQISSLIYPKIQQRHKCSSSKLCAAAPVVASSSLEEVRRRPG